MRSRPWRLLAVFALGVAGVVAQAADFSFTRVEVTEQNGRIVLDADMAYPLDDRALEALDNGVPLTFVTHIEVRERGAWIWQADLVDRRLTSTLRYHPLSGLYALHQLDSDQTQQFATRDAALQALGELRDLTIVRRDQLDPDSRYVLRLDTYLDLEALPLPLRPLAYLTPAWHLGSDPWEQALTP